jgi:hypothetical protein
MNRRIYLTSLTLAALASLAAFDCRANQQVWSTNDSGTGSLRDAILNAANPDTITFSNGLPGLIILTSGELLIGRDLTIVGPGATNLTVDGHASGRVFEISALAHVTIAGLTISNGLASDPAYAAGGALLIDPNGALVLSNCWVLNNKASGGQNNNQGGGAFGGGLFNRGSLTMLGCTVSGNSALGGDGPVAAGPAEGGGVHSGAGGASLVNCTITGNVAKGGGGGSSSGGDAQGGGIVGAGALGGISYDMSMESCTVSDNSALAIAINQYASANGGGVVAAGGGNLSIGNTIVASNRVASAGGSPSGPDVFGPFVSPGFNLIGITDGSSGWSAEDRQLGTTQTPLKAQLGPLQFNGGPTPTMMPQRNSAAIDNGNSFGISTDQRGLSRPSYIRLSGNPLPPGDGSDIGAVELQIVWLHIGRFLDDAKSAHEAIGLSWQPEPGLPWQLQQSSDVGMGAGRWTTSSVPVMIIGGTNMAIIHNPTGSMFFRLAAPQP